MNRLPRVTNLWSSMMMNGRPTGSVSVVVIETTEPTPCRVYRKEALELTLHLPGCRLNMPEETIPVEDGLLTEINVRNADRDLVEVTLNFEHPTEAELNKAAGLPSRTIVTLGRWGLNIFLLDKVIAIDPGHGGHEIGARGPVNLLEKDVVLEVANYLGTLLAQAGAKVVFTRTADVHVAPKDRLRIAKEHGAELFISLHAFGSPKQNVSGVRTIYPGCANDARTLAILVQDAIVRKLGLVDRGIRQGGELYGNNLGVPAVAVELVTISNPVEEGWLRNPVFKQRLAQGIFNGVKRYFCLKHPGAATLGCWNPPASGISFNCNNQEASMGLLLVEELELARLPIRTHLISEKEDIVDVIQRYVGEIVQPGDIIAVSESVVAITQGRAILSERVKPSLLASFLSRFPDKDGSLATPQAMELAIREVGRTRILLGAVAGGLGKLLGRRGDFYRVAGRELALIDDIAGTLPPYDRYVVLGPKDPEKVVARIKQRTGVDALIADVNDARCVDILATTSNIDKRILIRSLLDNPFKNDDQRTPIVILRPVKKP